MERPNEGKVLINRYSRRLRLYAAKVLIDKAFTLTLEEKLRIIDLIDYLESFENMRYVRGKCVNEDFCGDFEEEC